MTIALVDTSIFCNILGIPGMDQDYEDIYLEFEIFISDRVRLLLPMATILETGRHIAHLKDGQTRRALAQRFVKEVKRALDGQAPWSVPKPLLDPEALREYLDRFPDEAMRGISLGDLSIIREFERQCELHQARRVFIWSLNGHLKAYDREPKSAWNR